jgi:HEAT repeat protein
MGKGLRFAILIGSSEFEKDPKLTALKCPQRDVEGMREVLADEKLGSFGEIFVFKNSENDKILHQIEETFVNAGGDDHVLIYYSGHGKTDLQGRLYLTTTNTDTKKLISTSIPIETLRLFIENSSCRKIILILDCCYSGAAGKSFTRGIVDDNLKELAHRGNGLYILTASTASQTALERENDEYGLLTKHIIAGIKGGDADKNEDGFVSMDDLYRYIFAKVRDEGYQEPMQWSLNIKGEDLIIALSSGLNRHELQRLQQNKILEKRKELPPRILPRILQVVLDRREPFYKLVDRLYREQLESGEFVEEWLRLESITPFQTLPPPPPDVKQGGSVDTPPGKGIEKQGTGVPDVPPSPKLFEPPAPIEEILLPEDTQGTVHEKARIIQNLSSSLHNLPKIRTKLAYSLGDDENLNQVLAKLIDAADKTISWKAAVLLMSLGDNLSNHIIQKIKQRFYAAIEEMDEFHNSHEIGILLSKLANLGGDDVLSYLLDISASSKSYKIRRFAINELRVLKYEHIVGLLVDFARNDKDRQFRFEAIKSLQQMNYDGCVDLLVVLAQDRMDGNVSFQAIEILLTLKYGGSLDLLVELAKNIDINDSKARCKAIRLLHEQNYEGRVALFKNMAAQDCSGQVRFTAIMALRELNYEGAANLLAMLASDSEIDDQDYDFKIEKWIKSRSAAINHLQEMKYEGNMKLFMRIAEHEHDDDVRLTAIENLLTLGVENLDEFFTRILKSNPSDVISEHLAGRRR